MHVIRLSWEVGIGGVFRDFEGDVLQNPRNTGCVFRDSEGDALHAFARYLGKTDKNIAEVIGPCTGSQFFVDKGFNNIIIQTDSNYVVNCVYRR